MRNTSNGILQSRKKNYNLKFAAAISAKSDKSDSSFNKVGGGAFFELNMQVIFIVSFGAKLWLVTESRITCCGLS